MSFHIQDTEESLPNSTCKLALRHREGGRKNKAFFFLLLLLLLLLLHSVMPLWASKLCSAVQRSATKLGESRVVPAWILCSFLSAHGHGRAHPATETTTNSQTDGQADQRQRAIRILRPVS